MSSLTPDHHSHLSVADQRYADQVINIEDQVMVHRYLYYCLGRPLLADHDYDLLEKRAMSVVPDESPIHRPGSCLESSYSASVKATAMSLLEKSESETAPV